MKHSLKRAAGGLDITGKDARSQESQQFELLLNEFNPKVNALVRFWNSEKLREPYGK